MKYYTWKDVDRQILLTRDKWIEKVSNIEVYPERILIETSEHDVTAIYTLIGNLLERKIHGNEFMLDFADQKMICEIEQADEESRSLHQQKVLPLFSNVQYQKDSSYDADIQKRELPGVPVIAFHSYKGGVGRSLSVLSFIKGWTETCKKDYSLLVIDGDFEAPGLTWLCEEDMVDQQFSFLDLLVLAQQNRDIKEFSEQLSDVVRNGTMVFENSEKRFSQFFLPTYRYEQQLLDIYASPQTIVQG